MKQKVDRHVRYVNNISIIFTRLLDTLKDSRQVWVINTIYTGTLVLLIGLLTLLQVCPCLILLHRYSSFLASGVMSVILPHS